MQDSNKIYLIWWNVSSQANSSSCFIIFHGGTNYCHGWRNIWHDFLWSKQNQMRKIKELNFFKKKKKFMQVKSLKFEIFSHIRSGFTEEDAASVNKKICLDSWLFFQIYLLTSSLQFSIYLFIFSIIFSSHIHHITKSIIVKIFQITYNPNKLNKCCLEKRKKN